MHMGAKLWQIGSAICKRSLNCHLPMQSISSPQVSYPCQNWLQLMLQLDWTKSTQHYEIIHLLVFAKLLLFSFWAWSWWGGMLCNFLHHMMKGNPFNPFTHVSWYISGGDPRSLSKMFDAMNDHIYNCFYKKYPAQVWTNGYHCSCIYADS